ncbi:MAG: sulfatase/phosphatase domain-containing protein, partial [Fulvivirga sp.]
VLQGKSSKMKRNLYWHFPYYHPPKSYEGTKPCSALRSGKYKLIYFYEDERTVLYDLEKDVSETTDLSSQRPQLTDKLKIQLFNKLTEAKARFPKPNPDYSGRNE